MKTGMIIMAAVAVLLCALPTSAGGDTEGGDMGGGDSHGDSSSSSDRCPYSLSGNPFSFDLPYFGYSNNWPDSGYTSSSTSSSSEYSIPMDDPFWNEILLLGSEDLLTDYLNIVEYGNWVAKEKFFEKHKPKFQAFDEKLRALFWFGGADAYTGKSNYDSLNKDGLTRKDVMDDAKRSWNEIKDLASSEKIDLDFLNDCREGVFREGMHYNRPGPNSEGHLLEGLHHTNSIDRLYGAGYSRDEVNYIFGDP